MDGVIFESGKKKLRIRKYLDTCGQGLSDVLVATAAAHPGRRRGSRRRLRLRRCRSGLLRRGYTSRLI